jgi:hypothetical protein
MNAPEIVHVLVRVIVIERPGVAELAITSTGTATLSTSTGDPWLCSFCNGG